MSDPKRDEEHQDQEEIEIPGVFDEDFDDDDEDQPEETRERDIEEVFGRNAEHEQKGKPFFCWQMGNPGDAIRQLGPKAQFIIARAPNKAYTAAYDAFVATYERRGKTEVPKKKLRAELPKLYARFILVGIKNVLFQGKYLKDTEMNRAMLLHRYQPDLLETVFSHAKDLRNFQDTVAEDDGYEPEFEGEEQAAALGNA